MTNEECPIEGYYRFHKLLKCKFINMCNKEYKKNCSFNGLNEVNKKAENERIKC